MRRSVPTRTVSFLAGIGLISGILAVSSAGIASAAPTLTLAVNTTIDAHDAHAGDGLCADAAGACTLRAALEEANAQPAGAMTTVTLPAGTYKLTLGLLSVAANTVVVTGAGPTATVVKGSKTPKGTIISVAANAHATFAQLELTSGTAGKKTGGALTNAGTTTLDHVTVTSNTSKSGGGLTNAKGATLTLTNSTVAANTTSKGAVSHPGGNGGGILNAGTLNLTNSTITGNVAGSGGQGETDPAGAGGNGGGIANTGTVVASSSAISSNSAGSGGLGIQGNELSGPGGDGGGIYSSSGSVTLTNSTVSGNASGFSGPAGEGAVNAGDGAGIWSAGTLMVSGSTFSANTNNSGTGAGGSGGGLFNAGTATISLSTFTGNVAGQGGTVGGSGGAIANTGTLTLSTSTLSNNAAGAGESGANGGRGGGLYSASGSATLTGDTVDANASGAGGDAFFVDPGCSRPGVGGDGAGIYSATALQVTNSTLSGNTTGAGGFLVNPCAGQFPSGVGGGLASEGGNATLSYATVAGNSDGIDNVAGTVTLGGTIVADSTGANCQGVISETSGFNLDSGTSCGFTAGSDLNSTEPSLGALAANGGPTDTQALLGGSPAIDHGGTSANGCPATDQRGLARPDEAGDAGSCDIGAYESQGVA